VLKLLVGLTAIVAQGTAETQPCVTRQQVADATVILIPELISGAQARCREHLSADSFILQPAATQFAERARAERDQRTASAAAGLRIISGDELPGMRDETVVAMMGEGLAGQMMQNANPSQCRDVNVLIESVASLAPIQIGNFLGAMFGLAGVGGGNSGPPICRQ